MLKVVILLAGVLVVTAQQQNDPKSSKFVGQDPLLQSRNPADKKDSSFNRLDPLNPRGNLQRQPSSFDGRYPYNKKNRYANRPRVTESFQAKSYVHDDSAFAIMQDENLQKIHPSEQLMGLKTNFKQTATKTGTSSVIPKYYRDIHDDYLGLSKNEERIKIFYESNPNLAPLSIRHAGDTFANKPNPYKKMFNAFKTQRAGSFITKKQIDDPNHRKQYFTQYY